MLASECSWSSSSSSSSTVTAAGATAIAHARLEAIQSVWKRIYSQHQRGEPSLAAFTWKYGMHHQRQLVDLPRVHVQDLLAASKPQSLLLLASTASFPLNCSLSHNGARTIFSICVPSSTLSKRLGAGPHLPHHTCRKLRRKRSKLNSFKSSTTLINPNPKAVKPCALPNAYNSSCPHALASFPLLIFPGAVRRIFAPEGSAAPSCIRASWQGFRLHGRFLLRSSNGFERKHQINW